MTTRFGVFRYPTILGDRYKLRGPAEHRWWGLTLLHRALLIFCRDFISAKSDPELIELWRFCGILSKGKYL
jgi:hypothetical protein